MYKIILALAIMTTTAAVQLPLAFATPPPTAPPSTPGCTGNPHGGFFNNIPATGNPHIPVVNPTGNPHIGIIGPGVGKPC
jgi:hypothetical protein